METAKEILETVGEERVMALLGVGRDSIRKAKQADKMSASWLDPLEQELGQPLPRRLFNFKRAGAA